MTVISTKKLIEERIENNPVNRYKLARYQVETWSVDSLIEFAIQTMEDQFQHGGNVFVNELELYCEDNMDLEVYGNNVKLRDTTMPQFGGICGNIQDDPARLFPCEVYSTDAPTDAPEGA